MFIEKFCNAIYLFYPLFLTESKVNSLVDEKPIKAGLKMSVE